MSQRIVTIAHQRVGVKRITTSAQIWKDLVPEIKKAGFPTDDTKAVLAGLEVTLESPHAQLPNTDFRLYLVPIGIKGGAGKKSSEFDGKTSAELKAYLKEKKDVATSESDKKVLEAIGAYSKDKLEELKAKAEKVHATLSRRKPKAAASKPAAAAKKAPAKKATAEKKAPVAKKTPAKKETAPKARSTKKKAAPSDSEIMKDYNKVVNHLKIAVTFKTFGHRINV